MKVGVAGIGLIGGSLARDYKAAGHTVYVYDRTASVEEYAKLAGVADGLLDESTVPECDLIFVALFPTDTIKYMEDIAPIVRKDAVVIDCGGTKREICKAGFALAEKYGYTYVGGHPMAGTQFSGFKNSARHMFKGAPMVIVPPVYDDIQFLQHIKDLLSPAEFGRITVSTAEDHDRTIAFTSQMAHVVSTAYVKSPTAQIHSGLSAGSYQDMTRVARLNEYMWTDLLLENGDNLVRELDFFINSLEDYRDAIADNDAKKLCSLLSEGRKIKEKVDGQYD
jgi:prephenate dehydrogenase